MRLIEIRLLEGPNLYRLEPVAKLEIALGRRRTWYGRRDPEPHMLVRLAAVVPSAEVPSRILALVGWIRRLRRAHPDGASGPVLVHRSSDPGHWIITWPWAQEDRARAIADAALSLVAREIPPTPRGRLASSRQRAVDRAGERVAAAEGAGPADIRDRDRRLPIVSISGTSRVVGSR